MKTTFKSLLMGKVPNLLFVTACLVLGGLALAALQLTWDINTLCDKALQESPLAMLSPS